MKRAMNWLGGLLCGLAAAFVFNVACNGSNGGSKGGGGWHLGPGPAAAQLNCQTYDVEIFDLPGTYGTVNTLPAGWVPLTVSASDHPVGVRCTP